MTLQDIQLEVEQHRAVVHPLIKLLSSNPNDLHGWRTFARHHHHIVREFPFHIYALFTRLPADMQLRLFPVLGDEFPPGTVEIQHGNVHIKGGQEQFSAHADLQLQLCKSLGTEPAAEPLPNVNDFIWAHRALAESAEVDYALGVFGPGHEFAVPLMFRQLVSGAPPFVNPRYMFEHLSIDVIHAARFAEILVDFDLGKVRKGAMHSLNLRASAWDDILRVIEVTRS